MHDYRYMQLTSQYILKKKIPQKIEKVTHKNDYKAMKNAEVACCANWNGHEKENFRQGIGNFEIDEGNEKKSKLYLIFIV